MGVVDDSVEQSGGDFGVGKDVIPASELQIGRDNDGFSRRGMKAVFNKSSGDSAGGNLMSSKV